MGLQSKMLTGWVSGFEEEAGVMRNAMTTRAPGGANKYLMNKCNFSIKRPIDVFRPSGFASMKP